jgi:hypothetical protein
MKDPTTIMPATLVHNFKDFCKNISSIAPLYYTLFGLWFLLLVSWGVYAFYAKRE